MIENPREKAHKQEELSRFYPVKAVDIPLPGKPSKYAGFGKVASGIRGLFLQANKFSTYPHPLLLIRLIIHTIID
jgi:hypothetical protein